MTNKIEVPRELLSDLLDSVRLEADERVRSFGEDYRPHVLASLRQTIKDTEALLAAPEAPRQSPIGWFTDDYLTDKSSTTYDELTSNRWKDKGWPVQPLYSAPLSPDHSGGGAGMVLPEREALHDLIAEVIGGDTYDCVRVWSAWGVGTMSEDDFVLFVDQDERLYELADAILDKVKELNQ